MTYATKLTQVKAVESDALAFIHCAVLVNFKKIIYVAQGQSAKTTYFLLHYNKKSPLHCYKPKKHLGFAFISIFCAAQRSFYTATFILVSMSSRHTDCLDVHIKSAKIKVLSPKGFVTSLGAVVGGTQGLLRGNFELFKREITQ